MAKEEIKNEEIENKREKKSKEIASKDTKKTTSSKTKKLTKKEIMTKKAIKTGKKSEINKNAKEKITPKNSAKKASTRARRKKVDYTKSTAKTMLPEYYDLPYRYNQTIVKVLAQTPTTLFVYWDISDEDRLSLIEKNGENFFNETRPILVVHNITKNYSFELEINDFANSWYIRTQEPNCDYVIELGRRFNKKENEYVFINSSNNIISPNDHVLFEKTNLNHLMFKNTNTQKIEFKDFGSLKQINDMDKLYGNIYDVYSTLYDDELLNEIKRTIF